MQVVAPVDEDVVIEAYLSAELHSERFGPVLRDLLEQRDIEETALAQPSAAALRRQYWESTVAGAGTRACSTAFRPTSAGSA